MRQYNKTHATTIIATAALVANRFVSYGGNYASGAAGAGGLTDSAGVSETSAAIGDALPVVTHYSFTVEAGAAIAAGAFVKPDAGGTGKAITGSITDNCGRAREAAAGDGSLIEVIIGRHVHPTS